MPCNTPESGDDFRHYAGKSGRNYRRLRKWV
jgi:hypothetical protein